MNYEELLKKKLIDLFPTKNSRESVSNILKNYGIEKYEHEPYRVRLAALKLCGTDVDEIEKMIKHAKKDYRDILSWAEYPRQSKESPALDGSKKQRLIEADKEEYEKWLNT